MRGKILNTLYNFEFMYRNTMSDTMQMRSKRKEDLYFMLGELSDNKSLHVSNIHYGNNTNYIIKKYDSLYLLFKKNENGTYYKKTKGI